MSASYKTSFDCSHKSPPADLPPKIRSSSSPPPAYLNHLCKTCTYTSARAGASAVRREYAPAIEEVMSTIESMGNVKGEMQEEKVRLVIRMNELMTEEEEMVGACWWNWRTYWKE